MIIIGIDPHKKSHTAVAIDALAGGVRTELTIGASGAGFARLLGWARDLDGERQFALEDCRHVSGQLERFLLAEGETVVRVPPKLMGIARRGTRSYGKSDPIDARAVAEAARREPNLPPARAAQVEEDLRLLLDHRDDLVAERTRLQNRLRWHLHDLGVGADVPLHALHRTCQLDHVSSELASLSSVRARIASQLVEHCRALTAEIDLLQREIAHIVTQLAPELLALPGCGVLSAARLVAETGGALRFRNEAAFAMHAGVAPLPASSGTRVRYRLNRGGNRKLNAALHRIAITQLRVCECARAFVRRKRQEGKSTREAVRCLKRHIARRVFGLLQAIDSRIRRREMECETKDVVYA
jgi:transposase